MDTNTRILFYINSIHDGGAERVLLQVLEHFSTKCEVLLLTSFIDEFEQKIPQGVKRIAIESGPNVYRGFLHKNFTRIRFLRYKCKEYRPDVVVSFMREANYRNIISTIGLGIKSVVSVRNDPSRVYKNLLSSAFARCLYSKADRVVFQTRGAMNWFQKNVREKGVVINNPINADYFMNHEYESAEGIVTIGRLTTPKNHKMLINAFGKIIDKTNDNLYIYGEGPLREELEKEIVSQGLDKRVFVMGRTLDVLGVLKKAKLFVLSSDSEGMPNALLEAMAAGLPCISTDCPCGGPGSLITNNYNGMLVKVGDVEDLSTAMIRFLDSVSLQKKCGENAKHSVEAYKDKYVFNEWEQLINNILEDV